MDKFKIIAYYLIILFGLLLEIIFLFNIPYYRYSFFLEYLKIIRLIFGLLIFLIDIYFRATSISETILCLKEKANKKDKYFDDKNFFNLLDKILIIIALVISSVGLILNIVGVGLSIKSLGGGENSTNLQNIYSRCSLLLLFENILLTICWICFVIYWIWNILNFLSKPKVDDGSDKEEITNQEKPNNRSKSLSDKNGVQDEPVAPVGQLDNYKDLSKDTDRKLTGENIIK